MGDEQQPRRSRRSKRWCFTVFGGLGPAALDEDGEELPPEPIGLTEADGDAIAELLAHQEAKYAFQLEEAPDNKTPHFQGFVEFTGAVTMRRAKASFPNRFRPHLEITKGTRKHNLDYCTKAPRLAGPWVDPEPDNPWWNEGGQGHRSDLALVAQMVSDGKSEEEIASAHPATYVKFHRGLERLREVLQGAAAPAIQPEFRAFWIVGGSGIGKSHAAMAHFPMAFRHSALHGEWNDGYNGQSVFIWDDFDWNDTKISTVLEVADKYVKRLPVKGSFKPGIYNLVIFISNYTMDECYGGYIAAARHAAFKRRFTEIVVETREECDVAMRLIKENRYIEAPREQQVGDD